MKANEFLPEGLRDPKDNPCWKGYHPVGTKKKNGRTVPNCVPNANEDVEEATGDKNFDGMMKDIKQGTKKQATADRRERRAADRQRARDAFGPSPADSLTIRKQQGVAEGSMSAEEYKQKLISTIPGMMDFFEKTVKGWKPSKEQMLAAVETGYIVMKRTGDVQQAGKAVMDELNTLHRMSQGQQGVAEGAASRTCPTCDGSGEDTLDHSKPCHRCHGKGHIPQKQGVAEAGVKQLPTQGADYSKYDTDHLKMMLRPGILHRNEARFKSLIRKELQKREQQSQQGVAEGMLDNPGQPDSPVAQAIIRRILLQRTDLLAKYGPEYVNQAVDDVVDSVGDYDEIGSSDVSGWVKQVEWNLKNKLNQYDEPMSDIDKLSEESPVDSNGYDVDQEDTGEYDYEGDQAKDQLQTIVAAARKLDGILDDNENMPEWVQMKITKATDYLDTAADYVAANKAQAEPMAEDDREKIGGRHDPEDFDDMVSRLKKLAGAGPMKTVYDPNTRRYKNIPTAVQPGDKK